MRSKEVTIQFDDLDATFLGRIVQTASDHSCTIYLENGTKRVNAKSIMGMMALVTESGRTYLLKTDGPDEDEALEAMSVFFR